MTHSNTKSATFSIIHARLLSSKVAADMHLCAQYYGNPKEELVRQYAEELAQYLNSGYVAKYEFGYKKDGNRVVCWRYSVDENGSISTDDRAGKVVPYANVTGASFYNSLTPSAKYYGLTSDQQNRFAASLPVKRVVGALPSDGRGYWTTDRNYYSSGLGLSRQTFQVTL